MRPKSFSLFEAYRSFPSHGRCSSRANIRRRSTANDIFFLPLQYIKVRDSRTNRRRKGINRRHPVRPKCFGTEMKAHGSAVAPAEDKKHRMDIKNFFQKIANKYLWINLALMALFVAVMGFGVKWSMDVYTNHGEEVTVPNILHRDFSDAEAILDEYGLNIEVSDTGYVKTLPPNSILEQSIASGEVVKPGRIVFVIINSSGVPTLALPDVIDNCSYREARVRLMTMGFKVPDE